MKILNKIPENNMISPNFIQEENLENYIGFSKENMPVKIVTEFIEILVN